VLAAGTSDVAAQVSGGHVRLSTRVATRDPRSASAGAPAVDVVHNGDTKMRVHVAAATRPFWLVLGESQSPGWHARIVHGGDLGPSQLVDGYANGWLVTPPVGGAFDVTFEWTPQRQVWAAIWLSLLGVILCLTIIGFTWTRRRSVVLTATTPLPGDADIELGWSPGGAPATRSSSRVRWLAPSVSGLLGALVVTPWVGVLAAAVTFVVLVRPKLRGPAMLVPAALLGLCGLYIALQQYRYRYPAVFEWPTVFPRARTLAWIAVIILTADAIVEIVRSRPGRDPETKRRPGPGGGAP